MTITAEQRARTAALRAESRARQRPQHCPKHPDRDSRYFAIQEPGRYVKHRWLCLECAANLVGIHGATLRRP